MYTPEFKEQVYRQISLVGHRTITGVVTEAIHEHGENIRLLMIVYQVDQGIDLEYELHLARIMFKDRKIDISCFQKVDPRDEMWDAIARNDEAAYNKAIGKT